MADQALNVGPAAMRLVRRLRRQVIAGQLQPGARLPSVRRLSRLGGIGIHAASQVLRRIQTEGWARRRKGGYILRIADDAVDLASTQLRYEPPAIITVVSSKRIRSADVNLMDELVEGFCERFPPCSLRSLYIDRGSWLGQVRQLLEQDSRSAREVGFVLRTAPTEVQHFLASSGVPCVVVGEADPASKLPCLYQDMYEVGLLAGRLLLPRGRAVILCHEDLIGGEVKLLKGFQLAAAELGCPLPSPADLYYHLPPQLDDYLDAIDRFLSRSDRPSGIFAIRPEFALATVKIASVHHIEIPNELQVIGFPIHPMYRFAHPEITSIGVPSMRELGRKCAEILGACMGIMPDEPERVVVPTVLDERGSSLPSVHHRRTASPGVDENAA